jgi:secreted Zn-dependent insulinase-like peptidase
MSIVKASTGLMHLVMQTYRDVTHMETVEIPDKLFDQTHIRYLMLGTGKAQRENELVRTLHEIFAEFCFEGTRCKGDSNIYIYGTMKYITNLKNHLTESLERFMICAVFALHTGVSRKGIWAMINGTMNDR